MWKPTNMMIAHRWLTIAYHRAGSDAFATGGYSLSGRSGHTRSGGFDLLGRRGRV